MIIDTELNYGDTVFMKADKEQTAYTVVGFLARPGQVKVEVSYCGEISYVYDFEITTEKDISKVM